MPPNGMSNEILGREKSFFATVKVELAHDARLETRAAAHLALLEYIEVFYNGSVAIRRSGTSVPGPSSGSTEPRTSRSLIQVFTKPG